MNYSKRAAPSNAPIEFTNVTQSVPPPFFAVPSWWRRFVFWTLRPRELSVYMYVVSLLDKTGWAFPTHEQMAYELNLAGTEQIASALTTLEREGFLIRMRATIGTVRRERPGTVYARPAMEYTLLRLLDRGKIDGQLFPTNKNSETLRNELDTTESAVALGLRNLLGTTRYMRYYNLDRTPDALRAALVDSLDARLAPNATADVLSPKTNDASTLASWIEEVFTAIATTLGNSTEQSGSSRHFGSGSFSVSIDYAKPYGAGDQGIVQTSVLIVDSPTRRSLVEKFPWRTTDARTVAESMVARYYELAPEVRSSGYIIGKEAAKEAAMVYETLD